MASDDLPVPGGPRRSVGLSRIQPVPTKSMRIVSIANAAHGHRAQRSRATAPRSPLNLIRGSAFPAMS